MQLAVALPYAEGAMAPEQVVEFAKAADGLGYHSLWVAEAWSLDAFSILTWLATETEHIGLATGIVNVFSRTPALIGASAATLDVISNGRTILGLGASGPQVIEGWHGLAYDRPLQRTRETIEIVRTILKRERLKYDGEIFDLQMGLKLISHPVRDEIPIALASLGPKNVELTAEVADAWLPVLYAPAKADEIWGEALRAGEAKRDPSLAPLEVMPSATVAITDQPAMAQMLARAGLALYIGGMGSREHNFYNNIARRLGYEDAAQEIQDLYLSGDKEGAMKRVSDEMLEELTVVGDGAHVKDRLAEFADSGVDTLVVSIATLDHGERMATLEQLVNLV